MDNIHLMKTTFTLRSIHTGKIAGAVPTEKLIAACREAGEVKAYRISRDSDRWCSEPDAHLGYSDTDTVQIDTETVDAAGAVTVGRLGPARPELWSVGDRVEGGAPGTEDYDTGVVHEVEDGRVRVGWDSGVSTWAGQDELRAL
jgi:hypothetical protein